MLAHAKTFLEKMPFESVPTWVWRVLVILTALFFITSLVLYGVSIVLESRAIKLGRETRALNEENRDLHIALDRVQSYQKVANASAAVKGLKMAEETVTVIPKVMYQSHLLDAPETRPPKEYYGF